MKKTASGCVRNVFHVSGCCRTILPNPTFQHQRDGISVAEPMNNMSTEYDGDGNVRLVLVGVRVQYCARQILYHCDGVTTSGENYIMS